MTYKPPNHRHYVTLQDFEKTFSISRDAATKRCQRAVGSGDLKKVGHGIYKQLHVERYLTFFEKVELGSLFHNGPYLSLVSSLYYHGLVKVEPCNVEFVSRAKFASIECDGISFKYYKSAMSMGLGVGSVLGGRVKIAGPESALLDALYLQSFGKYSFDWKLVDWKGLNFAKVMKIAEGFPLRTRKLLGSFLVLV